MTTCRRLLRCLPTLACILIAVAAPLEAQPPDPIQRLPGMKQPGPERPEPDRLKPEAAPEDAVFAFVFWLNQIDLRRCVELLAGAEFKPDLVKLEQQARKERAANPTAFLIGTPVVKTDGDKSVVTAHVTFLATRVNDKDAAPIHRMNSETRLELRRENGLWKIVPGQPRIKNDFLLQVATGLAHPERLSAERDGTAGCLSNVKQLCLGAMQLAQDYDGKFALRKALDLQTEAEKRGAVDRKTLALPDLPEDHGLDKAGKAIPRPLLHALLPYVKNLQILHCPQDEPGIESYSFNENLLDAAQNNLERPDATVLIYEGKNGKINFRHDGMATIGYADGHVKLIREEEAKLLIWKLPAGDIPK